MRPSTKPKSIKLSRHCLDNCKIEYYHYCRVNLIPKEFARHCLSNWEYLFHVKLHKKGSTKNKNES